MKCERCGFEIPSRAPHQDAQNCLDYLRVRYEALRDKSRRQAISAGTAQSRIDRYQQNSKLRKWQVADLRKRINRWQERDAKAQREIQKLRAENTTLRRQLGRIGQIAGRSAA